MAVNRRERICVILQWAPGRSYSRKCCLTELMSYQERKPLYTRRKSKNYKWSSDGNSKSLRRKKDAAQTVHHLLTYAERRNSRRQTLKNMRTGNNKG